MAPPTAAATALAVSLTLVNAAFLALVFVQRRAAADAPAASVAPAAFSAAFHALVAVSLAGVVDTAMSAAHGLAGAGARAGAPDSPRAGRAWSKPLTCVVYARRAAPARCARNCDPDNT
jgi:hypothetical protein